MKELADIIALARSGRTGPAALATVVRVEGSSYRRPGASLLIGPDGRRLGSVSGGCLERDVESHAKAVLASGQPRLITYDTRDDADVVFGTALGCGGLVEVFIERVELLEGDGPVGRWGASADRREALAEIVVIAAPTDAPIAVGARAWVRPGTSEPVELPSRARDGDRGGSGDGSADLWASLLAVAQPVLAARGSAPIALASSSSGELRAFVRVIDPPVRLIVCGAGDDAQPLVQMAHGLGWRVWVFDHRAGFAKPERFPGAERVELTVAGTLPPEFVIDPRTVAVVMNHNYPADGAWLRALAPLPLTYLGLLGARHRTARLLSDADLPPAGPNGLPHLFAPAGLDIGAEGPESIALAMLAEIQTVLSGRRGGLLRESPSPIQQRPIEECERA